MMHEMVMQLRPILCQFPLDYQNQTLQLQHLIVFKIDEVEQSTHLSFLAAKGCGEWFNDKNKFHEEWQDVKQFLLKDAQHTYLFHFSETLPELLHTPFWGIAVRPTQWVIRRSKDDVQLMAKFEGHPQSIVNGFEILNIHFKQPLQLVVKVKPHHLPSLNWKFKLCNN